MNDVPHYATDTHPLVWHLCQSKRLSVSARSVFHEADQGRVRLIIPTMVLIEIMYLAERNRITTQLTEIIALVRASTNYRIVPIEESIITVAQTLSATIELHDRLIAATAKAFNVPLLTKDDVLRNTAQIQTLW